MTEVGSFLAEARFDQRGELHDRLGVVGDGMLHRLVGRGDPQSGGVVVGPVVQPAHPPGPRVHHGRDRGRAVSAEDRLRGLDLDLEAQAPGGQPVRPLDLEEVPG